MWFRNLQLFTFTEPFTLTAEEMEAQLLPHRFMPCRTVDAVSQGFFPPNGDKEGPLVYAANGFLLFCLKREEKIVPASVVKEMVDEKIAEIERSQGRKVRRRENETLKEDIFHQLVIRAFSKTTMLYGYIDPKEGYLVVNASTHSKAEELTAQLRQALGSLKIEIPKVQTLTTLLTHWLMHNEYPPEFSISDHCLLQDPKDKGTIRCQGQNLLAEDIQTLIHEGRVVSELGLTWTDHLRFSLKEDFSIKSIKFLELVQDQAKDILTETPEARFDADYTIMTETFRAFIHALFSACGASSL